MTEIELKPCPFCGGKADFNNDGERWQQVICGSCGCRGCEYPDDKAKAASFWNRRPTPEAGLLELVAVYCDQQAAIERSEGESMCDPANFSAMRAYEDVAKFARGLLSATVANDASNLLPVVE